MTTPERIMDEFVTFVRSRNYDVAGVRPYKVIDYTAERHNTHEWLPIC